LDPLIFYYLSNKITGFYVESTSKTELENLGSEYQHKWHTISRQLKAAKVVILGWSTLKPSIFRRMEYHWTTIIMFYHPRVGRFYSYQTTTHKRNPYFNSKSTIRKFVRLTEMDGLKCILKSVSGKEVAPIEFGRPGSWNGYILFEVKDEVNDYLTGLNEIIDSGNAITE
jgi:hypothetical protein